MKIAFYLLSMVFGIVGFSCSNVIPDAAELAVDFSWEGMTPCGWGNPQISIGGVPEKTKKLLISMYDSVYFHDHGELTITCDGTGNIKMLKLLVFVSMILSLLSCGRNEPLSTYEPKSPQEAALKSVLVEFQNGVNTRDAGKIESLIHEKASIMVGRERKILSKAEYRQILPKRLADNPPIALGKPKINVEGDTAEVKIYLTRGNFDGLVVYNMKQENNQWYIQSWKY